MNNLDVLHFSKRFVVRKMKREDVPIIYNMTSKNVQYYKFCGRESTMEDIYKDVEIVPPGKDINDKYYVGFFEGENLVAVMDLIKSYPDDITAYIGFFMMNHNYQGKGLGTIIISEICEYLKEIGFGKIRLGYDKENPQSKSFWIKNKFEKVKEVPQNDGIIVVAERRL